MSRFSWDYLPLEGNSFFDQRGMRAPQVRIRFASPPSGSDLDPVSIKYAIEDKYHNVAQQSLYAFRQNMALGVIQYVNQQRQLPDGTLIEYSNNSGQEFITITVSASAVKKLLNPEFSIPCMLVLYNGNRISAIPMGSLWDPKPVYSSALKKSSWGSTIQTIQMPCGGGTIAVSQIDPVKSRLKMGGFKVFSTTKTIAFLNSLEVSAGTSPLIAACDGSSLRVGGGTFTTARARVSGSSGNVDGDPYAIDSSGRYYYGLDIAGDYLFNGDLHITSDGDLKTSQKPEWDQAKKDAMVVQDGIPDTSSINGYTRYGSDSGLFYKIATNAGRIGEWVTTDPDASLDVPYQMGGYTKMGSELIHVSASAVLIPNTEDDHMDVDMLGQHFHSGGNQNVSGSTVSFPPSLSENKAYLIDAEKSTIYTPYQTFSGDSLSGWLHVSNGTHMLQGFKINDTKHLYHNNTDFLSTLTAAVPKCSEVNGVLLDIPLNVIKRFV